MLGKRLVVIFGGTFDPAHLGYVSAVKQLQQVFFLVVVAPTAQNPLKERKATPKKLREEMLKRVFAAEGIELVDDPHKGGVMLLEGFDYQRSRELVEYWLPRFGGKLYWAIGPELVDEFPTWSGGWLKDHVRPFVLREESPVHATDIRSGKEQPHPAIRDLIAEHGLYLP